MAGTKVTTELDIDLAKWKVRHEEVKRDIAQMKQAARSGPSISEGLLGGLRDQLSGPLGAALSVGAVKSLLGQFDDLADAALKLGETPETLQRVGRAAELSGSSVEGLAGAFLKLEKNLGDPENDKAAQILEKYGITAEALIAMPLDQKILAIADAFQKARAEGTGVNELQQLMGKSAAELIPLLSSSGDELRGMFDGVNVVADESVYAMAALNDEIDNVIANLTNLGGQALMKAHDGVAYFGAALAYIFGDEKAFENVDKALIKRITDAQEKADSMRSQRQQRARATQSNIDQGRDDKGAKADEDFAKKEEDRWKRIDQLTRQMRDEQIDLLPPKEKLEALKKELKDVLAAAAAESDIEKQLQQKLEALKLTKQIESTQQQLERDADKSTKATTTKTAALPGEVAGVFNVLFGRSANELMLDESRQQTQEQRKTNQVLTQIREELRSNGISSLEIFGP